MTFYVLEPAEGIRFGRRWAFGDMTQDTLADAIRCPVCNGPVTMRRTLPPYRIRLSSAKPSAWGDIVWNASFMPLVSARFKAWFEANGLRGITVFHPPAEVTHAGRRRASDYPGVLPIYHLIEIEWNGANQDDVSSRVVRQRPETMSCSYCRVGGWFLRQTGVFLEPGSWTGADIFTARGGPVPMIVSDRFKQAFEASGLTNAWFVPAEKYGLDYAERGGWYLIE